jgi:hypothetical protein
MNIMTIGCTISLTCLAWVAMPVASAPQDSFQRPTSAAQEAIHNAADLPFEELALSMMAVDQPVSLGSFESRPVASGAPASEIEVLKKELADQQRQIDQLRRELAESRSDRPTIVHRTIGEVTSTTPILPPVLAPTLVPAAGAQAPQTTSNSEASPLQLKIGDAYVTPVGFMDLTSVTRSTNPGTGIGTNFGSIPYDHTQAAALSETRLTPQNSRIGMRVDALVKNMKILGYWESDFLGQLGAPPNGSLAVSSNPYVFRMRLYFVDVRTGKVEFLAGQSWSMMTPNRKGISPLPGDIFYTQDNDTNYQVGLVWGRVPGFRVVLHPTEKVAFGVALENSEPYIGGANGGSAVILPAAIAGTPNQVSGAILGGQINNGLSVIGAAALHPDILAKLAFDPTGKFHFEIAGVEITNKIANPASTPAYQTETKAGGAVSINLSYALTKNLRLLTNNYYGAGAGRYIFGQAPDFMIRADGGLSLIRSGSTVSGLEATAGKTLFYAYYGGVFIGKNLALDANGKTLIGYGPLSSDGQNRAIQEITVGSNTTLAKDPKWGALSLLFQYSYVQRNPWLAAASAFSDASLSMGFATVRYTLPGSAPALK